MTYPVIIIVIITTTTTTTTTTTSDYESALELETDEASSKSLQQKIKKVKNIYYNNYYYH